MAENFIITFVSSTGQHTVSIDALLPSKTAAAIIREAAYRHTRLGGTCIRAKYEGKTYFTGKALMDALYPQRYPGSFQAQWQEDRAWAV